MKSRNNNCVYPVSFNGVNSQVKSSHPHLYRAFNKVDCFKAALER